MKKFVRTNKATGEEETMISAKGTLLSLAADFKTNTNGKEYKIFTAEVTDPRGGKMVILGQVYHNLMPYLGALGTGKEYNFLTRLSDLKEKNNNLWTIGSQGPSEVSDDFLADLDQI